MNKKKSFDVGLPLIEIQETRSFAKRETQFDSTCQPIKGKP